MWEFKKARKNAGSARGPNRKRDAPTIDGRSRHGHGHGHGQPWQGQHGTLFVARPTPPVDPVAFDLASRRRDRLAGHRGFALDRDVKKSHVQAAIGVRPCASKDEVVAQYAPSRTLSPGLIADDQTQLPGKALLAKPNCMSCMRKTRRLIRQRAWVVRSVVNLLLNK